MADDCYERGRGHAANSPSPEEVMAARGRTAGNDQDLKGPLGIEKFGIDPALEEVMALANTSIFHTSRGLFRIERLSDSLNSRPLTPGPPSAPPPNRPLPAVLPHPPPSEKGLLFDQPSLSRTLDHVGRAPAPLLVDSTLLPELGLSEERHELPPDDKNLDRGQIEGDRDGARYHQTAGSSMPPSRGRTERMMAWSTSEHSSTSDSRQYPPAPSREPSSYSAQRNYYQTLPYPNPSASHVWCAPVADTSLTSSPPASDYVGQTGLYDTSAAIVVSSESVSAGRHDEELPGEVLILETSVSAGPSVRGRFNPGYAKVFRNSLTGDLRLVTITNDEMTRVIDKHLVRVKEVELVPMYAYNFRHSDILYLQTAVVDDFTRLSGPTTQAMPSSLVYKFNSTKDMLDFQGKILEEDVCFDISNVRSVVLAVAGGHTREIYSPRVQLWHQRRSKGRLTDDSSFVTSGTKLSASDPERTNLLYSRFVVYLGRSQEFITFFVTDDVSYKIKGETILVFSATKYSGINVWKSRRSLKCGLVKRSDGPAGIRLDKAGLTPDDEGSFSQYKILDVAFEDEKDRSSFLETWEHMIRARRNARERLRKVQLDMATKMYTGTIAAKIIG